MARRILRDTTLAEDATQQALLDAWRNLPGLRDPGRFEAWAHRLLVNALSAHVVITVREDIACDPDQFYLLYNEKTGRYATAPGSTIRVWIIDVGEARVWIDGETYKGASPESEQDLQQIVDSIQFEGP